MTVFDLMCELTHFDPYCEVYVQDKNGDYESLSRKHFAWNGDDGDGVDTNPEKYRSSELFITMCLPEISK